MIIGRRRRRRRRKRRSRAGIEIRDGVADRTYLDVSTLIPRSLLKLNFHSKVGQAPLKCSDLCVGDV
jgi:hypothetical protein